MLELAKRSSIAVLATALSFGVASADDGIPPIEGVWKGVETGGVRFGTVTHGDALEAPTFVDSQRVWTLVVEKQQGQGIIGTWSGSAKVEKMLGVIRADNKTILFSDEDNVLSAILISDTKMEMCAQKAEKVVIVATCMILEKQHAE